LFSVAAVLAGLAVAPAAVSALGDLFDVDPVPELGSVPADVAPAFLGREVPLEDARATVPFEVRTIGGLGAPDEVYVRDDIVGGTVTVAYDGRSILLTQWPVGDVRARIAVVPADAAAEEITVGGQPGLWVAGRARGTITVVGADGAVHRELFDVADGALMWRDDAVTFLLQGAGTRENAVQLAVETGP
jgi:hypothetical protein